jgi:hypothetical protein
MVDNSTNINKTNNNLLPKSIEIEKVTTYYDEHACFGFRLACNCGEVKIGWSNPNATPYNLYDWI